MMHVHFIHVYHACEMHIVPEPNVIGFEIKILCHEKYLHNK